MTEACPTCGRKFPNPRDRRAAGLARAASLSPARRAEIASIAAKARWAKNACTDKEGVPEK